MGESQEVQLNVRVQEVEANSTQNTNITHQSPGVHRIKYKRWLRIALYILFVLVGQTVAILLGRLYYEKGGKSKWMETLMQLAGFPILLLFYFTEASKNPTRSNQPRSSIIVASVYASLGLLAAFNCFLFSVGILYLPVSTVTLISASRLGFNAFFSFFLNSQKFTPLIINSLVLLTISSTLLVFQDDSGSPSGFSKLKFAVGFICTVGGSAGCGLALALTQLCFRKVLKRGTFKEIVDFIFYQSIVATCATLVGLFVSREWKGLNKEMEEYELGKVSYVMTISSAAMSWQVFSIGIVGLIFEVSSLFCNAISVLGFPVVPVMAVIFFHDKMDGLKVISMLLALWGFISYVYQQYLDSFANEVFKAFPSGL